MIFLSPHIIHLPEESRSAGTNKSQPCVPFKVHSSVTDGRISLFFFIAETELSTHVSPVSKHRSWHQVHKACSATLKSLLQLGVPTKRGPLVLLGDDSWGLGHIKTKIPIFRLKNGWYISSTQCPSHIHTVVLAPVFQSRVSSKE